MEGKATNGGYAIDQLVFSSGKCSSKLLENIVFLITNMVHKLHIYMYVILLRLYNIFLLQSDQKKQIQISSFQKNRWADGRFVATS